MDLGGGKGMAMSQLPGMPLGEYRAATRESDLPKMTLVTYKTNLGPEDFSKNTKVLQGKYFDEIPDSEFEKADLITDMYGIFSYSHQKDEVLRRIIPKLKSDGEWMIYYGAQSECTILKKNGEKQKLFEWLKSIPGIEVESISGYSWYQVSPASIIIRRKKTPSLQGLADKVLGRQEDIKIPRLELIEVNGVSMPPIQHYREID